MIQVVISGASGRLGRRVLALAARADDLQIVGALVRDGSELAGQPAERITGEPSNVSLGADASCIAAGTVLLEVATRAAALAHAERAAAVGAPMLIATTGFEKDEQRALEAHAQKVPVVLAPNLSVGIAVLTELVEKAARALADYDLEIVELHHNQKRDAPSGTAWALARAAAKSRGQDLEQDAILARAGETGVRGKKEIGIQSIRGGDIIGEHTVYLASATERLELTHRAASRDVFAAGALVAARFLGAPGRAPGLYRMRDVLGL